MSNAHLSALLLFRISNKFGSMSRLSKKGLCFPKIDKTCVEDPLSSISLLSVDWNVQRNFTGKGVQKGTALNLK